jgi:hypothetical protein
VGASSGTTSQMDIFGAAGVPDANLVPRYGRGTPLYPPEQPRLAAVPEYSMAYASPPPAMTKIGFFAGPRRDPISRELHIRALAEVGRTSALGSKLGSTHSGAHNLFGSGAVVPDRWPASWEVDLAARMRAPLMPPPPRSAMLERALTPVAGSSHPSLGVFAIGPPPEASPQHYALLTAGLTEEEKRQFLLTGERARRNAWKRYLPTDVLMQKEKATRKV